MKKIFFAIVSILLAAGCAKENLVDPMDSQNVVTVLTAGTPPTKTVLWNDQNVLWIKGDKINVNGVESNALDIEDPPATASFTISGVLDAVKKAVFPASIFKNEQTVTLPAVQTSVENSFGANASPMAAYTASGNNLKFKHLCAVLKLNISKGEDTHEIAYVEFSGKNNEKVCGDFTIDYTEATLAPVGGMTFTEKKVRCNVGKAIPDAADLVVYIVVPAIEYSVGYTVRVVDTQGHYMEVSKKSGQTLAAGTVYDMPEFVFAPTDTKIEADVKITSAGEFVEFVQKYNANEYASDVSVALMNNIVFDEETSDAFNAAGGLGGRSGMFQGHLYGNNKTVKNLKSTVPLIFKLFGGTVKDLILDETTSFNFTLTTDNVLNANLDVSAIVCIAQNASISNANISNVEVKSNISLSTANITSDNATFNLGAIVGRHYSGTLTNCIFSGNITVPSDFQIGMPVVNVGGICGATASTSAYLFPNVSRGSIDFAADILGYQRKVRVAGIIGYSSRPLNGEENNKNINISNITVDQVANGAHSHIYNVAGIVGESKDANVSYAINAGKIEAKATDPQGMISQVYLSGIVGNLSQGKSVQNCENSGEVYLNLTDTRYAHICDAFMAYTTYASGKSYGTQVQNCTDTGNVH